MIGTFLLLHWIFISILFWNNLFSLFPIIFMSISRLSRYLPDQYGIFRLFWTVVLVLRSFTIICYFKWIFIQVEFGIFLKISWMLIFLHYITRTLSLKAISWYFNYEWYQWIFTFHQQFLSKEVVRFLIF